MRGGLSVPHHESGCQTTEEMRVRTAAARFAPDRRKVPPLLCDMQQSVVRK